MTGMYGGVLEVGCLCTTCCHRGLLWFEALEWMMVVENLCQP
jgi:hypothetical protein